MNNTTAKDNNMNNSNISSVTCTICGTTTELDMWDTDSDQWGEWHLEHQGCRDSGNTHTPDNYDQGDTCHECCTEVPNGTRLCSECAWVWDLARPWN